MPKAQQLAQNFHGHLRRGQLLEELFTAIPEVFYFVKDLESRFMGASPSFARMLGESSVEELLGKTDYDYSVDFLAEAFIEDDKRVMATGQTMANKIELVPSGLSLDWQSTTKTPLYNDANEIIGLAGISHIIKDSDDLYQNHPEMWKIIVFIRENFRRKISNSDLADAAEISVSSLERLFRATFGVTPLMYLRKTRLNAACRNLRKGELSLSEIATFCGFNDQTSMTRAFRQDLKITPLKYRQRFSELPLPNSTIRNQHIA